MTERCYRAFRPDIEIRADSDGRTVHGIAAPFNSPAPIAEGGLRFLEVIVPGAFAKTISERTGRIKFLSQHRRDDNPLGVFTSMREDSNGLYVEARVSKTAAGDDVLELVRDGALDGWSIGFSPVRETWHDRRTVKRLHEVRLREVSLVTFPAYDDARVVGVRADGTLPGISPDAARRRLELIEKAWL